MKHKALFAVALLLLAGAASAVDEPEPIHRDESPQPTVDLPAVTLNPAHRHYVLGHLETRHVDGRPKDVCFRLTHQLVNEDFMKCRNGYDWKAWVAGHYDDRY